MSPNLTIAGFTFDDIRSQLRDPLILFGFLAQFVFFLRFVVQWWASERHGRSVIPVAFWWLSVAGGLMILVYAYQRKELVFTVASILQLAIYARNLMLIHRRNPTYPA